MIGEDTSRIGPESQKFLTDDKLYQVFAILIKADVPVSVWREAYKLFVHPAGMYFGGQVSIESTSSMSLNAPDYIKSINDPVVQGTATLGAPFSLTDLTGEIDSDGTKLRIDLASRVDAYQDIPISEIDGYYDTISEFIDTISPTMDADSAVGDTRTPRADMDREVYDTMDQVKYTYYDSDSA